MADGAVVSQRPPIPMKSTRSRAERKATPNCQLIRHPQAYQVLGKVPETLVGVFTGQTSIMYQQREVNRVYRLPFVIAGSLLASLPVSARM